MNVSREEVVAEVSSALEDMPAAGGVGALDFIKVDEFTSFSAEYAEDGNDIVFHFFLPPELLNKADEPAVRKYWTEVFPQVLEPVAVNTFKAGPPRLQASFVQDFGLNSWWLRAFGFASSLDPAALCNKFLFLMDQALDATKTT